MPDPSKAGLPPLAPLFMENAVRNKEDRDQAVYRSYSADFRARADAHFGAWLAAARIAEPYDAERQALAARVAALERDMAEARELLAFCIPVVRNAVVFNARSNAYVNRICAVLSYHHAPAPVDPLAARLGEPAEPEYGEDRED